MLFVGAMRGSWLIVGVALMACGGNVDTQSTGADGAAKDSDPPPREIGSKQKVTFAITNGATTDRWIVTDGFYCTPFEVERAGSSLSLQLGFTCECECASPGTEHVIRYERIAPGATTEIAWDARALVTFDRTIDCAARGWPGEPPQTIRAGVLQPVSAGTYTAVVGFETTPPDSCSRSGDEASCTGDYGFGGPPPPAMETRCRATSAATASFDLPVSGDVRVPITLH